MANLNIRNLSDEVHAALRIRAAKAGRSMEAEARALLSEVCMPARSAVSPDDLMDWVDAYYEGHKPPHVVEDLIAERRREAADE
jgi:plasmid stability protein